jgi:hypothetical protein
MLSTKLGFRPVAIDIDAQYEHPWVKFETSSITEAGDCRRTDTSLKRNLGLLLARMANWERVVFLDDDITVPDPHDLGRAATMLRNYHAVGLSNEGFQDNSVVCHAHRDTGGKQETFVGGGALAVAPMAARSFFPHIYNEDWFFLLGKDTIRPVAVTGTASQQVYDPYASPARARAEEFGDVLAEGLFRILDERRSIQGANEAYWAWFLQQRRAFIEEVLSRTRATIRHQERRDRMLASLEAARAQARLITPQLCAGYLRAWRHDRARWQQDFEQVPRGKSIGEARRMLDLPADA